MGDLARLAVHQLVGPVDGRAECLTDRLMSQAHSEHGDTGAGSGLDQRDRRPGTVRRAGARAEQNAIELSRHLGQDRRIVGAGRAVESLVVVPPYLALRAQLSQVLDEVVDEAVVVVDDEDAHRCSVLRREEVNVTGGTW